MSLLVIFNPASANGRARGLLPAVERAFLERDVSIELRCTTGRGDGMRLVQEADLSSHAGVVAAGGDGTLFEVINGLESSGARLPVGLLPLGTGNAFVREWGLERSDWLRAIEVIAAGETRAVDLGQFDHGQGRGVFANVLGLGFVAEVAATAHRLKRLGNFSYTLATVLRLAGLRPSRVALDLDGRRIERENVFIEICNTRYTADFLMAPEAEVDDGLLDVVLLNAVSRVRLLRNFRRVLEGSHVELDEVEVFRAGRIHVSGHDGGRLTPDGEVLGAMPVTVRCRKRALEVFWPRSWRAHQDKASMGDSP